MDLVNEKGDTFFYIVKELAPDVRAAGRACVSAFGVRSRCTHLEFFRLTKDHPALGKKGTIVGLEVNMRPSGGFTPEMINYACSTDFYRDWADMVCFDRLTLPDYPKKYFAAHYGRRKEHSYRYSHEEIMSRWGENVMESGALDPALATAMGDIFYIARFETEEEMNRWRAEMSE